MFYFRKDIFKGDLKGQRDVQWGAVTPEHVCLQTGCNPGLDGTSPVQNGLETDGAKEEYTLMSIDTIINGQVRVASYRKKRL